MKKIAVLNDLSGMGKCSLTAAISVLSVMGVQICPLPTAILSAQTGFPSYYYDDYTEHIREIMREWKKMDFHPDGIYTGFLAGDIQAERVLEFIEAFQEKNTKILVDPVMGDNGEEYPIYTEELCERMRCLAERATIITPNLTEALLLLYGREKTRQMWREFSQSDHISFRAIAEQTGSELVKRFQTEAVITGIDLWNETQNKPEKGSISNSQDMSPYLEIGNLICNEKGNEWVVSRKEGGSYSGTGDLFASVICAGMVKENDTVFSVKKAVSFLSKAIHDTVLEGTDRNEGVCFETYLYELSDCASPVLSMEKFEKMG